VNLGAGGVAAVLAGELLPGEVVGVEIHLPQSIVPLRARARVRHHDKLRCGMEFVGLSAEQQAAIRNFTESTTAEPDEDVRPKLPVEAVKSLEGRGSRAGKRRAGGRRGNAIFLVLGLRKSEGTMQAQAQAPADVMEKLVTHRVDPDYPAAARPAHLKGVIVLDVVVGRDGNVAEVRALNGPQILAQSAVEALRWWRFQPYRVEGQPVVVETTVAVEFKP
jgi:TonB family protein